MALLITPETKVGALLEAYPGIEEVLIERVPAFAKLKNPILRKTVARVATLEQAAKVGGVGVRELVQMLREAVGQSSTTSEPTCAASLDLSSQAPEWLVADRMRLMLDADAMLATGEHPLGRVQTFIVNAQPGEIAVITSSFYPAPLVEMFRARGCGVHSEQRDGKWHTYICRL